VIAPSVIGIPPAWCSVVRSRFGPYTRGQIVGAVSTGATLADAARHAGVPVDTAKCWLRRGRRESGTEYAEFVEAVEAARVEPLTRGDLLRLLGVKAREGNVTAIRLLLSELRRDEAAQPPVFDPLAELDGGSVITNLAARRGRAEYVCARETAEMAPAPEPAQTRWGARAASELGTAENPI
jgi:hypothetical protein